MNINGETLSTIIVSTLIISVLVMAIIAWRRGKKVQEKIDNDLKDDLERLKIVQEQREKIPPTEKRYRITTDGEVYRIEYLNIRTYFSAATGVKDVIEWTPIYKSLTYPELKTIYENLPDAQRDMLKAIKEDKRRSATWTPVL